MMDPGRRRYFGLKRQAQARNEPLVDRLSRMSDEQLLAWCDRQLREWPAAEAEQLLIRLGLRGAAAA